MIDKLVISGVGLIGGSLALALRQAGQVRRVVGVGRGGANPVLGLPLGAIAEASEHPAQALAGADVVLLALPVAAMADWFARIASHLGPGALVTDAGSTKQDVIAAARTVLGSKIGQFVPGHPIAGAERSGVGAARADLYQGKNLILTPLPENDAEWVARADAFWQAAGAQVLEMAADEHDRVFAAVSHLPHLAAFALVDELASRPRPASSSVTPPAASATSPTKRSGSQAMQPSSARALISNTGQLLKRHSAEVYRRRGTRSASPASASARTCPLPGLIS